jgi:sugar/nucleoside kinase (ribokinase family)
MSNVLGLGNALVDIIFQIENDGILNEFGLPKGSMTLVDAEKAKRILRATEGLQYEIAAGGSASNTIDALARLEVPSGYIGKIGKDKYGDLFEKELISKHIRPNLLYGHNPTGTAITLLSKDAERTFATFLGAAIEMEAGELNEELFKGYSFFHIEGYLVQNHDLILKAVSLAKKAGITVSIDMASFTTVEANKDFLQDIVKDYVNIVFANEEEARSFTGEEPQDAARMISGYCDIAVVKIGKDGSIIQTGPNTIKVSGIKAELKDTTGAGDLYAAGFLYGLTKGFNLELCGQIGSLLGGKVIEVYGARLNDMSWKGIKEEINRIIRI